MPGSRVNLGMGQPGRKAAKGKAVKKAKGGSMMKPPPKMAKGGSMMKPPGMNRGGGVQSRDATTPVGAYKKGGDPKKPPPNKGAAKLPKKVRNRMGFMQDGGPVKKSKGGPMRKMAKGGPMRKMAKGGPMKKMAKGGSMYKKGKKSGPKP